ncbi:phosphoribosylamine--glycine ligase [Myxococcota bacterium]|nr:phosphoribosylamine--glycine ligase [Myxococcota bacterium]
MTRGRVLVVGSGGREHALVDVLANAPSRPEVFAAPGNPGIAERATVWPIAATDVAGIVRAAEAHAIDLVVVGPEAPLVLGLADALRARGIAVLGPSRAAAALEGSKTFAKAVMDEGRIPTARWGSFTELDAAIAFARSLGGGSVVKADGLAAGKGVVVADDLATTEQAIREMLGGAFGDASRSIVVEEKLEGEELSVLALTDGKSVAVLAPAQDHKRIFDGDRGPNTGGMGAYSPAPRGTPELLADVQVRCLQPVIDVMARRGTPFSGILYAGLMLTADGPRVLEYNVRFGDPEAQAILSRLDDDAYELFSAVARGALGERAVRSSSKAAVTVVLAAAGYPADPRRGDVIEGLDRARAIPGVLVHHAGTQAVDGRIVTAGGRVLGVTGLGADLVAAAETAYRGVAEITFDGMSFRRDIAHRAIGRAIGDELVPRRA